MDNITFTITPDHAGKRLDVFISEQTGRTRSQIKIHITGGRVHVNGEKPSVHRFLKAGDTVTIDLPEITTLNVTANHALAVPILYEDDYVLCVNKPHGMVVHQSEAHKIADTLVNWVIAQYPAILKIGADSIRPGIVHRLDRAASGIMLIAKTQESYEHLITQFKLRSVKKSYLAVVHGTPSPTIGTIDFDITKEGFRVVAQPHGTGEKRAITHYENKKTINSATGVLVHTDTGRMHQIRAHFFAINHPLIGDTLYSNFDESHESRLMLHAQSITFTTPDYVPHTVNAPTPPEFAPYF